MDAKKGYKEDLQSDGYSDDKLGMMMDETWVVQKGILWVEMMDICSGERLVSNMAGGLVDLMVYAKDCSKVD